MGSQFPVDVALIRDLVHIAADLTWMMTHLEWGGHQAEKKLGILSYQHSPVLLRGMLCHIHYNNPAARRQNQEWLTIVNNTLRTLLGAHA